MLLDDVSVSRDRIEISENTRAKGTTFSLFGSLTNVVTAFKTSNQ